MSGWVSAPWKDFWPGFELCLDRGGFRALAQLLLGLALGWWVYVPIHELLHALACFATGGQVSRLEIAYLYGGAFWASMAPWITAGSDYAGRLSGFDTGGNDLIYLATVLGPYLLTVFPGVLWLRWAGRRGHSLAFGPSLPLALAPFMSLPGDAYEVASILVTRLPPWTDAAQLLRGDDVFLVFQGLATQPVSIYAGFAAGLVGALIWASCTYLVGAWVAEFIERRSQNHSNGSMTSTPQP